MEQHLSQDLLQEDLRPDRSPEALCQDRSEDNRKANPHMEDTIQGRLQQDLPWALRSIGAH